MDKWYQVSELSILNIIGMAIKEHHHSSYDMMNLQLINKSFSTMIPKVLKWLWSGYQYIPAHSRHPKQLREQSSIAT
jgi:hypothetical protein